MAVVGAALPILAATPARAATDPRSAESAFVSKINSLRASKGLSQLRVDSELTSIGRRWAAKMASDGDISHNPAFSSWVTADWVKLGENVGTGGDVDTIFRAFVASPSHYKNLVDPAFQYVGVGVVVAADGAIYTAHQFEQKAGAAAAAPAAPAAPAAAPAPAPAPRPAAPKPAAPKPVAAPAPVPAPAPAPAPAPPSAPAHAVQVLEQLRHFDQVA